ncbi:uncharacterized protein LOC131997031 [Stomoxys calcitrans]|uniref:uncharacterized protein LOC131997031 n=1 Tax=Stomoxys calcitrans TaxID=35570 RepID=UPI0027E298BD|nr:uncharacterized protein LOC131997031 [Stomoxys calcitrans]
MVCRLCLKAIPSESVIKLYQDLNCATEALEMVKHIEKYLDIEVRQDDVVSTMICQDCHDHLEEFHKFYQDVKGKQCTRHNNFLEVELKEESHDSRDVDVKNNDDSNKVDGNDKISNVAKEIEQAMFESPIDIMKTEADDEKDEQEVIATDVLDDDVDLDKEDVFADDGVDIDSADLQSSEDDVPLINLKTKKKITLFCNIFELAKYANSDSSDFGVLTVD